MRWAVVLILCNFLMSLHATAFSQTRVTLKGENLPLKNALEQVEKMAEVKLVYRDENIINFKVSFDLKNATIQETLNEVLKGTGNAYQLLDNNLIVISPIESAQSIIVTGKVTDASGEPLPGVGVLIKGTTQGTATDANGVYSLQLSNENAVLVFSFIGFVTQEIAAGNKRTINVTLVEDTRQLEEVVVVGYGVQKKVNLSGAVESVSVQKLANRSTNNVGLALQGIVPSLVISPGNGQANTTPSYNIRGTTSINGGSPLILVDGVPTDAGDFSRMNPADIENMSVLKDASSAAIYGARASFGVILVTTKKGQSDKLTVNFNNTFNVRKLGRMPDIVTDPYINASYREIMGKPWYSYYDEATLEYAKRLSQDPSLPDIIMDPRSPQQWLYLCSTDWIKEVYGNGMATSNSHNLNISGKSKNVSYYLGTEYYQERGMIKVNTDVYDKFNIRSHVEYKPTNWLTVGNNTSLQYFIYKKPTRLTTTFFWNMLYTEKSLYPVKNPDGTWGGTGGTNSVAELQEAGDSRTNQYVTQTQFNADVALVKDVWHIKGDFTARYTNNKVNEATNYVQGRSGPDLPLILYNYAYHGWDDYAQRIGWGKFYTLANLYSDFTKTYGKHAITALVGYSQEYERYEYFFGRRRNMITTTYPTPQLATGSMTMTEDVYEWALRSGFFRLNYIFNNRYILEANGRYDGTSRFPKKNRFGFFPSASAAWVISEEGFFEPLKKWMNYAKLRASYGSLGNQNVGAYQYIVSMSASRIGQLVNGSQPMGIYTPGLVSDNLTWEKVNTVDVGADMNFLTNRLMFSFDIYRRETKDMLSKAKTLPAVLGTSEPRINAADLVSKGWELSLGWNDRVTVGAKPLNYNARFILYDSRAFITRFDNPNKNLSDHYVGKEMDEIWGMVTEGYFTSQADIDSHADQVAVASYPGTRPIEPGDLKYKDLNGDGKIDGGKGTVDDPGDYKIIGNSSIRYSYGLDLGADWNGWDVRFLFQGIMKREIYPLCSEFFGIYFSPHGCVLKHNLDHWTPENPNPNAFLPRMKSYLCDNDLGFAQTRYLQNARYMRMKNITLGYALPKKLFRSDSVGMRIYFTGENLFEITPLHKMLDPEASGGHVHPFQRTFAFGINITL